MHARSLRGALAALVASVSIVLFAAVASAEEPAQAPATPPTNGAEPERERMNPVLMYLPNRLFDLFDMVRLRARVGPGFALSARATEALDATLGGYTSIYVGLPGPRHEPRIPWPLGIENFAGVEVSVVGSSEEDPYEPKFGNLEVGAGTHLLLVGLDVGVDPGEVVDFVLGLVTVDFKKDDY
jgi:hypothetical protein